MFGSVYSVVFLTITLFTAVTPIPCCAIDSFPSRNPSAATAPSNSLAWQVFTALDVAFAPGALCGADQMARVQGLAHTVCRWPSVGGGVVRRKCCSAVKFPFFVYQHESGRR